MAKKKAMLAASMAAAMPIPAKRFVFTAATVAVGARIDSAGLAESWAPSSLPVIGGRSSSLVGPTIWPSSSDPILRFDVAETTITGRQLVTTPGAEEFETVIRKTVTNLNILNRLTASIGVEMRFHYTRRPTPPTSAPRQRDLVDVTITFFNPFVIDTPGVTLMPPLPNPIGFEQRIPISAGADFKAFLKPGTPGVSIDSLRPPPAHLKHEHGRSGAGGHGHGVIYTALVEPAAQFTYDVATFDFGKFNVPLPDLGPGSQFEVYVGEWYGQPYWQSLTFLRAEFKNIPDRVTRRGTFSGEIVIDDGDDGCPIP